MGNARQAYGSIIAGSGNVGAAQAEAVHGAIVERCDVNIGVNVGGKNATNRLIRQNFYDATRLHILANKLARLVHADRR